MLARARCADNLIGERRHFYTAIGEKADDGDSREMPQCDLQQGPAGGGRAKNRMRRQAEMGCDGERQGPYDDCVASVTNNPGGCREGTVGSRACWA